MKTLTALPAVDERSRFGAVSIGYDKIIEVRTEHAALVNFVAMFLGVPPEKVTLDMVTRLTSDVQQLVVAVDDETHEADSASGTARLLARAAAQAGYPVS